MSRCPMLCPSCSRENPEDAAFCGECGAALTAELGDGGPHLIAIQKNGKALLTIDLSSMGMANLAEVEVTLAAALGAELPYSIEVAPGQGPVLSMELLSPFTFGTEK